MRKKQTIPSAFEDAFSGLGYGNPEGQPEVTDMNTVDSMVDVEPFKNDEPDTAQQQSEDDKSKDTTVDQHTDTTDIPEDVLKQMNDNTTNQTNNNEDQASENNGNNEDVTDADFTEAQQVGALFDAVVEKFGWDVSDIEDEHRPVTVEGLTDYIRAIVDENSKPEYADERIQALDQYVKQGGRFEDFYAAQQQQLNYDSLDLTDESNQRTVVRELLRSSGYTEEQINSKIDRYESADMLEEEAEDALSRLKVIKQQETARLQKEQEELRAQQEEQNRAFFNDVNTQIKNLTEIRGVSIPKEDRKALFEYIFKTDANGVSQYQKDFNKNLTKNLIESAYFTMRADAFVNGAKKTGETTAAQKLRQMLRHSSKNHTSYNADEDKQRPAWEIASKFL